MKPVEEVPVSPLRPLSPMASANPGNEPPSRYPPDAPRPAPAVPGAPHPGHPLSAGKVTVSIPLPPSRSSLELTPFHPGAEKEAGGCSGSQQMGWGHQGHPEPCLSLPSLDSGPTRSGAATASMTSWTGQATPQCPQSTGTASPDPARQAGSQAAPPALRLHPCLAAAEAVWGVSMT